MVIQPQTMEDSEYTDMCSCGERGIYDSPSLSEDIWKKFDLDSEASDSNNKIDSSSYPTPPSSPQHEFCPDTEDVLKNNLHNIDDESLSRTFIGITTDVDNIQCNLIQDCMWSAPGLVAAGLIPEKSVKPKAEPTVDENSNNISPSKKQSQLDINTRDCVDPAAVFPCSSRNNSPSPSISGLSQSQESSYDLGLDTPSASSDNDSDDDDEDDDDEEIDVVNVQSERHHSTIRRHHSYPASLASQRPTTLTLTLKREREPLSTLPAATSMSAQVAAMHNYSSSTGTHHNKSPSYKSYHSYSSPQTPSTGASTHTSSSSHKRLRPYSSPASPQSSSSSSSKRQKMVVSENDLKCVVRKLTSRRSHHGGSSHHHQHSSPHHHHNHHQQVTHNSSNHNSRSSSDYEDNSDIGKRAYHNVLERKRRDDLRTSFHQLRERVPEIEANERAPKMMILNKSTEYITELTQTHQNLISELQRQKQQHEQLKRKLTLLRKEAL